MSVFTTVTRAELAAWLKHYSIGSLVNLQGIASGIENTNYFVTTTHGRFVLTLFEKLNAHELPFYLELMAHLSRHGIPAPKPIANLDDAFLDELNGKPASLVTCLNGAAITEPTLRHCAEVGEMLADMHLAGRSFSGAMENPRGPRWWQATAPKLVSFLGADDQELLQNEVRFQSGYRFSDLPRGVIHADVFRDNVLFDGESVGGVIDFYFACVDVLLYDVAIAANDWCIAPEGVLAEPRVDALLRAYHGIRPFTDNERDAWPIMLRAASLRFWVSRLYDFHLPRPGELTHSHDPEHFRRILLNHIGAGAQPSLPR